MSRRQAVFRAFVFLTSFAAFFGNSAYSQTSEKNFDFGMSPCYSKSRHFTKAYAQRIFPSLDDGQRLIVRDGITDWSHPLLGLDTFKSIEYLLAGALDAWAVYGTLENKTGIVQGFSVQYMFGGLGADSPVCQVFPVAPERVSIDEMAPGAVHAYATRLAQKPAGTLTQMRRYLEDFVKPR